MFMKNIKRAVLDLATSLIVAIAILTSFASTGSGLSQETKTKTNPDADRAELYQALLDLTNTWTVMCVAAHPDDEDGTTLSILRRKYGSHTVSLFSTYGEGGQNAVGPELYEELGVIRAHETMAAAEIQGSEPYFLGLSDFGYSKSAEEAFRAWGEKEALRRMVLQIRQLRPDVIITNHDTLSGHGQHQATGRLILQAFDAAADPNSFPEQLQQVSVWQPQRLFVRFGFDPAPETKALQTEAEKAGKIVTLDPNEKDPVRGDSFAEEALTALQQHATQGPWPKSIAERLRAQNRDRLPEIRYRLARETQAAPALPANAKNFTDGLHLPLTIGARLAAPTLDGGPLTNDVDKRGEVLIALINAKKAGAYTAPADIVQLDPQRFQRMSSRLDRALELASGVNMEVVPAQNPLVPGTVASFSVSVTNSGDSEILVRRLSFSDWAGDRPIETAEKMPPGTDTVVTIKSELPQTIPFSVPAEEHLYDGRFLGQPIEANAKLEIEGAQFAVRAVRRVPITPAVEIKTVTPSPYVLTPAALGYPLHFAITLSNHQKTPFRGFVKLSSAEYGFSEIGGSEISLDGEETKPMNVQVAVPVPMTRGINRLKRSGSITISIEPVNKTTPVTQRNINAVYVEVRVAPNLKVGYVPSSDDSLVTALNTLRVDAKQLTPEDVQSADLTAFDTIIIDNRGYQAHPELIAANGRLLDYVNQGGNLIVFYHKSFEWNPDEKRGRPQLAPYPIIVGDDRVTDEKAPVKFLLPRHRLMLYPNRITQADFNGWIQERGLYYPKEWDKQYVALFSSNDEGEPPLTGGLLVARYGRGTYIYTSMVWYRQLRGGIPGGYRFFANLISYGK